MSKYDLEDRLLKFSANIILLSEQLPKSRAGNHIAGQILRSGTSAYPNHGEAQAAESRKDFVHKMRICLKELRETLRWLNLVQQSNMLTDELLLRSVQKENDKLIRIFMSSIRTASSNQ